MSIINDALKKAEKESNKPNFGPAFVDGGPKKRSMNWGPVFVALVFLLITGPILAPVFSTPSKTSDKADTLTTPLTQQVPAGDRRAQFGIEELPAMPPLPAAMPGRALWLSGIVFSPAGSYCIINNRVAKPGDEIHGAKILTINSDSVQLEYQGEVVTLRTGGAR